MSSFFITGTGTGIGKTLVTAALCSQLKSRGKSVTALKPVITGYDAADEYSDTALILKSCGLSPTPQSMEAISPWRFAAPLAPSMAAAAEHKTIDMEKLAEFCREHTTLKSDVVLAEGAGGVMTPLGDSHTMLDLMAALAWPVILVTGTYLGALTHTLTAIETLRARAIALRALAISQSAESPVTLEDTAAELERFLPRDIPLVKIPRLGGKRELWTTAPPISWMCDA